MVSSSAVPLPAQCRRDEHDDNRSRRVNEALADDEAGFDRLTEADFVSQQVALHWVGEDPTRHADLVSMEVDRSRGGPVQAPCGSAQQCVGVDKPGARAEAFDVAGAVLAEISEWVEQRRKAAEPDAVDWNLALAARAIKKNLDGCRICR